MPARLLDTRGFTFTIFTPFARHIDVRNYNFSEEVCDRLHHLEFELHHDTREGSRLIRRVREVLPDLTHRQARLVLAANLVFFDTDHNDEEAER